MVGNRYALRDLDDRIDGEGLTWWLYLEGPGTPHIGEWPLEAAASRHWWRVPSHLGWDPETGDPVELVRSPGRALTHWRLNNPNVTGYPPYLTQAQYLERTDDEEPTYDRLTAAVYEPVYEELPDAREPVEGDWLILDGAPAPIDGREWLATLPSQLRIRAEYRHLFPGFLIGFRAAVNTRLNAIPGIQSYEKGGAFLSVYAKVHLPKLDPVPWEARRPPRKHQGRHRDNSEITDDLITRHLEFHVPDRIEAENQAAGARNWDAKLAEIVGYISALVAHPCPGCGGRGWLEDPLPEEVLPHAS